MALELERADRDASALEAGVTLHVIHGAVDIRENARRMCVEGAPGVGQANGPARPVKKTHAQLAFELADLNGKRGLRDPDDLRRSRKVAFRADRRKVSKLPKFHNVSQSIR